MGVHKGFFALILLIFVWLAGKFLLPFGFPFLFGLGIAMAAEPVVRLGTDRLKLRRSAAAGLGVTVTLGLLLGLVFVLGGILVREAGSLAQKLPSMAKESAGLLEDALISLSDKAPEPIGPVLTNSIHRFFQDSTVITNQAVQKVPGPPLMAFDRQGQMGYDEETVLYGYLRRNL